MKKLALLFSFLFISTVLLAQNTSVEMADELRNSGKIYVVVAVMLLLFTVLILYLFTIDRRLKKLERN